MLKKQENKKDNEPNEKYSIINLVNKMEQDFLNPIILSDKNTFSQYTLVSVINLYINSKFKNLSPEEAELKGKQFYNIISQALKLAKTKTDIDRKDIIIEIKDKVYRYLLNAANVEFMDDYDFGTILNEIIDSYYTYGTAVLKVIDNGKKNSMVEVVDFSSIIWHQGDYRVAPIIEKKSVVAQKLFKNNLYNTAQLEADILENKKDFNPFTTSIDIYELHGILPKKFISLKDEDTELVQQTHILAKIVKDGVVGTKFYCLYSGLEKEDPYFVIQRNHRKGRSMGYGIAEELLQAQVATNEAVNIMIDDIRASGKNVWFSDDPELDGVDLSEIDNNVVIRGERDTKLEKINTQAYSYNPAISYLNQWVSQSKEQSFARDAVMGDNVVSGEAYRARQLTINQVDGIFDFERELIGQSISKIYKERIASIVIDYIKTNKSIEELLTGEQLRSYQGFLANLIANYQIQNMVSLGYEPLDFQEAYNIALDAVKESDKPLVDWGDIDITPKVLIDKMRILITNEQQNVQNKIATLNMLATQVMTRPDAYPNIDIKEILDELVSLSDRSTMVELFKGIRSLPIQEKADPLKDNSFKGISPQEQQELL